MWVARAKKEEAPFLEDEKTALVESLDFLHWIRNELHFESKKKKDQLTFDQQEKIARILGFEDKKEALAVEAFMQKFYLHALNIRNTTEVALLRLEKKRGILPPRKKRIDEEFALVGGKLSIRDEGAFEKTPLLAMKAFEHSQTLGVEIERRTKDLMLKNIRLVERLKGEAGAGRSFMKILGRPGAFKTLSIMHEMRFLGRYISEFSAISCKVQHDLYHVYTVDVHSLFAVRELEGLRDIHRKEFPLLSGLLKEVEKPEILTLAVLLHDVGKAFGSGHAEKGAEIVPAIARDMGLTEDDAAVLKFLVRNHLLLADTAQYRDIHDERLTVEFAKKVGDAERLKLLYLLTFADVRAVGPEVWTTWKGALFQELYFTALSIIERGSFEPEDAAAKIARIKSRLLKEFSEEEVENYLTLLPRRYFLSTPLAAIPEHIRITKRLADRPCVLNVRQVAERHYTELTVCAHDIHGLFSMITGVLAANSVNILGAQINTLTNGIALDVLQVSTVFGDPVKDEVKLNNIERDLVDVITGKARVETLVEKLKPSILDKKIKPRVPARIAIDNEVSEYFTVLDIHAQDRIGLLYKITSTLSALGLYIHISKISTKGAEAADIFYVRDIFGQKILNAEKLKKIEKTLYEALG
jgi:[protein-PII] uridylyltransferase